MRTGNSCSAKQANVSENFPFDNLNLKQKTWKWEMLCPDYA